jgi:hypothetical protein
MGSTNRCVGNGKCVQCAQDGDCSDPGVCMTRHCDLASGTCSPQPAAQRTSCSGGLCDGSGQCLQCLVKADCGTATCKDRSCNSGSCVEINSQSGTTCSSGTNGRVCDDSGNCVACDVDADCNGHVSVDPCHEAACTNHSCGTRIKAWQTCGSSKVCNGSTGSCDPACGNGHLDSGEDCDYNLAPQNNWSCNSQTCKLTGVSSFTYRKICTQNADCNTNETCAISATLGAYWSVVQKLCMPSCSSLVCVSPPGYNVQLHISSPTSCPTSSDECLIVCTSASDCPPGVNCTPNLSNSESVCLGPTQ